MALFRALRPFAGTDPIVVAGDFNATPSQGPYELISTGRILSALKDASISQAAGPYVYLPVSLSLSTPLVSAYKAVTGSEPHATTHVGHPENFHECLDYIFFSKGIEAVGILSIPEMEDGHSGFPNATNPSDHVPIGAIFQLQSDAWV